MEIERREGERERGRAERGERGREERGRERREEREREGMCKPSKTAPATQPEDDPEAKQNSNHNQSDVEHTPL